VRAVELEIGPLAAVNVETLRFAFEIVRRGTLLAEAGLVVHALPLLVRCRACESEYPAEPEEMDCPVCGALEIEVLQGTEMRVCAISGDPPSQPREEAS